MIPKLLKLAGIGSTNRQIFILDISAHKQMEKYKELSVWLLKLFEKQALAEALKDGEILPLEVKEAILEELPNL